MRNIHYSHTKSFLWRVNSFDWKNENKNSVVKNLEVRFRASSLLKIQLTKHKHEISNITRQFDEKLGILNKLFLYYKTIFFGMLVCSIPPFNCHFEYCASSFLCQVEETWGSIIPTYVGCRALKKTKKTFHAKIVVNGTTTLVYLF